MTGSAVIFTPTAAAAYNNISSTALIEVYQGSSTIGVRNTTSVPINIQYANIIIEKIC